MKVYEQRASGRTEEVNEGFNGFAFLFGSLWYLFKGMVGRAILLLIGTAILSIIFGWVGMIFMWIMGGVIANKNYEDYLISKGYSIIKISQKNEDKEKKKSISETKSKRSVQKH